MERTFNDTLSALRRDKGVSQRSAATALGVSQALLSHYENGIREPGLDFVRRACAFYGVSADYLLCLSEPAGGESRSETMRTFIAKFHSMLDEAEDIFNTTGDKP